MRACQMLAIGAPTGAEASTIEPKDLTGSRIGEQTEPLKNWRASVMDHHSVAIRRVENLAYQYWEARGRPIGSPEEDWFRAEHTLHSEIPALSLQEFAFAMGPTEEG